MDWQQLVSLLIVGATVLTFIRGAGRGRKSGSGCANACGCSAAGHPPPQNLIFRKRKGERPQVFLKAL